MPEVETYVTEWGFPALRWRDRIATMKGNPQKPLPKVRYREIARALWIGRDGVGLFVLDHEGSEVELGRWELLKGLAVESTRKDLSPEQTRLLGMNRLVWVEHQTLEASFADDRVKRVAVSAVSRSKMERMQDVIWQTLVVRRENYVPPGDGTCKCWRKSFVPEIRPLELTETSRTCLDASGASLGAIGVTDDGGTVAKVEWIEPAASISRQWFGRGTPRRYVVARKLFAARGYRPRTWRLCFRSYKPGTAGVVEVNADLAFLKDLRIVSAGEIEVGAFQPLEGLVPGLSVVADFRYGLSLPLTSAFVPGAAGRQSVEDLRDLLRSKFLPLVGQRLTDAELGE